MPVGDLIPKDVGEAVSAALENSGHGGEITSVELVGGGSINHAARLVTPRDSWFLKWNPDAPPGMFAAEDDGLRALARSAGPGLRVPAVLGYGPVDGAAPARKRDKDTSEPAWLLMEWIERGSPGPDFGSRLGPALAELHSSHRDAGSLPTLAIGNDPTRRRPGFGWRRDNWIGSLPQANEPGNDWGEFWRDRRLVPQLERAWSNDLLGGHDELMDRVVERVPDLLAGGPSGGPGLLHGDLWSGNVFPGGDGRPVLVDPAVYRGHGEVDLAMSELFGGFDAVFRAAYREAAAVDEGYDDHRRALYQLYYLLVHVNLFGSGYLGRTVEAARKAVGQ